MEFRISLIAISKIVFSRATMNRPLIMQIWKIQNVFINIGKRKGKKHLNPIWKSEPLLVRMLTIEYYIIELFFIMVLRTEQEYDAVISTDECIMF